MTSKPAKPATPITAGPNHVDLVLERATLGLIINIATLSGPESMTQLESAVENAPAQLMSSADHQTIWTGIRNMLRAGQVPAALELSRSLPAAVSQTVWDDVVNDGSATVLTPNLDRLAHLARLRQIVGACQLAAIETGESSDPETVISTLMQRLESAQSGGTRAKNSAELGDPLDYLDDLLAGRIPMVSTGFAELDDRNGGGFEQGSFNILAMKTNIGKTKFALKCVLVQLESGNYVLYLSGELKSTGGPRPVSRVKLMCAMSKARVAGRYISRGTLDKPKAMRPETRSALRRAIDELDGTGRLDIHDGSMDVEIVISLMRQVARKARAAGVAALVVIDNIDHVTVQGFERKGGWEGRDEVVRRLMSAAHSTGATTLALAQIKLDKNTSGQTGELEDLAGFKGVSAHADCVITAWRDRKEAETRALSGDPRDPSRWLTTGTFEIVKRRAGVGGSVQVGWNEEFGEWYDLRTSSLPVPPPHRPQPPREDEENMPAHILDELFPGSTVREGGAK